MRALLLTHGLLSLLLLAGPVLADRTYIFDEGVPLFSFSCYNYPSAGVRRTLDLPASVPANATAVFVQGLMLITKGQATSIADMNVRFYKPGATNRISFSQVLEAHAGGGQRSPMATWIPVLDHKIDFYWSGNGTSLLYPAGHCYGLNLVVQAYLTPDGEVMTQPDPGTEPVNPDLEAILQALQAEITAEVLMRISEKFQNLAEP